MANFYALPALTNFATAGGWSNTSGGPSNGATPGISDAVIFDANSGPARTISTTVAVGTINTTGAAAMTFTGTIAFYGNSCNLTGMASVEAITFSGGVGATLVAPNVVIGALSLNSSSSATLTLGSDITVTGAIAFTSDGYFSTANFNVTSGSMTAGTVGTNLSLGSSTWTLTGTGTVWSTNGNTTVTPGTSTIKIANQSTSSKVFDCYIGAATYYNLWVAAAGPTTLWARQANLIINNELRVSAGATVKFSTSGQSGGRPTALKAANFNIDGTAAPITLTNTGDGTAENLECSTNSTMVLVQRCNVSNVGARYTSNPGGWTFRAVNSTITPLIGSGWSLMPGMSSFLSFI